MSELKQKVIDAINSVETKDGWDVELEAQAAMNVIADWLEDKNWTYLDSREIAKQLRDE